MIVVDTNVGSELMRPSPSAEVRSWVRGHDARELCTTAVTVAEIRYGIERLPSGSRKETVRAAAVEIFGMFEEQILPVDAAAAEHYAQVASHRDRLGFPIDRVGATLASI